MNEVNFKPAVSVALYASRLIISTEPDSSCFDVHGTEFGLMKGYQLNGDAMGSILDFLDIGYKPVFREEYRNGKPIRYKDNLKDNSFSIINNHFTILYEDNETNITKLFIAESGNGGLQIKLYTDCGDDDYFETISYFGPYSIRWCWDT